jgi:hypothetical protein
MAAGASSRGRRVQNQSTAKMIDPSARPRAGVEMLFQDLVKLGRQIGSVKRFPRPVILPAESRAEAGSPSYEARMGGDPT